jgi:acyl carrier protein
MPEPTSAETRSSLVAFVTLRPGVVLSQDELKAFAAQKLPRHLVPNRIEIVETMPNLPNGKLDRRSLRERATAQMNSRIGQDADGSSTGQTATEEKLIELWASVLSADYVETSDDFFELGGHSLLATRLVATTNRELGCNLSIADLFDHPVLSDFARLIDSVA